MCYVKSERNGGTMVLTKSGLSKDLQRLASYARYPDGDTPSAILLARCGFEYSGQDFKVICPLCRIEIEKFSQNEDPLEEHKKRSPNCPSVLHASEILALPARDHISEEVRRSFPVICEEFDRAMRRCSGQVEPCNGSSAVESPSTPDNRLNPDYELLRSEQTRLETFHNWPASANAIPAELAREGLFYTGIEDKVYCAFCRNGLHSWEPGDVPSVEHKKFYPKCPFVQNRDVGNVKIENESRMENLAERRQNSSVSSSAESSLENSGAVVSVDTCMTTPTVRAILEMGFSAQVVQRVVQEKLEESGEFFPNAETLLDKLLSLGIGISSVPSDVETNGTMIAENAASVEPRQLPETAESSAQASSQNAVAEPFRQGSGATKRRKARKKKKGGGGSTSSTSVSSGLTTNSNTTTTTTTATTTTIVPQVNNSITSDINITTSTNTIGSTICLEGEQNNGLYIDAEEQELIEENARLREARTCKVCMDKEVNTVFLPCGHLICCNDCSPKVRNCPLCRTFIRGTVKTFLS